MQKTILILLSLVVSSVVAVSCSTGSLKAADTNQKFENSRQMASVDDDKKPKAKINFAKAACSGYLVCGISEDGAGYCKDFNTGSRGGTWQMKFQSPIKGISLGRGWDLKQIQYLRDGFLSKVNSAEYGKDKNKVPADELFDSQYSQGFSNKGQLVYFDKDMGTGDNYTAFYDDGRWRFHGTSKLLSRFPEFFESIKSARKISADNSKICALFEDGSGKCLSANNAKEQLLEIPRSESLQGLVIGQETFFWSATKLIAVGTSNDGLFRSDQAMSNIAKIISPRWTYILFKDGSLKVLNGDRSLEAVEVALNAGKTTPKKQKGAKFKDVAAGNSSDGEFCLVDQAGRLLKYWPGREKPKEILKESLFNAEPDSILE